MGRFLNEMTDKSTESINMLLLMISALVISPTKFKEQIKSKQFTTAEFFIAICY